MGTLMSGKVDGLIWKKTTDTFLWGPPMLSSWGQDTSDSPVPEDKDKDMVK